MSVSIHIIVLNLDVFILFNRNKQVSLGNVKKKLYLKFKAVKLACSKIFTQTTFSTRRIFKHSTFNYFFLIVAGFI